ncbi:unnamed protein product [Mytilus edulis]|uniref:Uncharacterized protein n=1 Tax=Mytilus edulis TaxID=6550 RepID=A0A8S3TYK6_MYTED|nr:unnamed protein product [Mytilus edulis]
MCRKTSYWSDSEAECISSGSKTEGLDLPGSDIDIMLLMKKLEVYENKPEDKEDVIILDTANALPGFALLKVAGESDFPTTNTTDGTLLANSDVIKFLFDEEVVEEEFFEIHGPSLSNLLLHDIDMVTCLKCHSWPKVALKWFCRPRPSGWPSQDIISNVLSDGVLVVPVGSRSSSSMQPEYHKMYQIILFASSEISLDKHRFSGASHVDNRGFLSENYQFLNADFPDIGTLGSNQSLPLFFFLNFLYTRKRGSFLETQSALKLLEQAVKEKSDTPIHWICTMSSYNLLHKAFELSNDKERGKTRESDEIKAITSSDKFDVLIKWAKDEEIIKLSLEVV